MKLQKKPLLSVYVHTAGRRDFPYSLGVIRDGKDRVDIHMAFEGPNVLSWHHGVALVESVVKSMPPTDRVVIYGYNRNLRTLFSVQDGVGVGKTVLRMTCAEFIARRVVPDAHVTDEMSILRARVGYRRLDHIENNQRDAIADMAERGTYTGSPHVNEMTLEELKAELEGE